MSSPVGCLSQGTFNPLGPPTAGEIRVREAAPAGIPLTQRDLFQRAAEMMATGALTQDQARMLSRQLA